MYPFIRLAWQTWKVRKTPSLVMTDTHVSHHLILPWDLDPFLELNNGRTLTIFDLGRIPLGLRTGLKRAVRTNRWGMTVAGSTVRYRRRVVLFDRLEMHSRGIGWDARFFYVEQSLWRATECTSHVVVRMAVTSKQGIVPPERVLEAMGYAGENPILPDWVQQWSSAEAARPWPPER
ncbi:acyl-CoA thioesterase [Neogemmobacter tilapiae]|uniref:Thioeseterase n=1 Tax=Neogemmobacter tilapiae TaxID=875041 RepID=A0A918TSD5_9RHOB|nr:acyl-CoA thioesterase [Gemmobacter tilapiae]GHC57040.1 thioeseterase [Gemmobacter tilapiae]